MNNEIVCSGSSTDGPAIPYVLCCDWGTSFLRLRLMNTQDYQCVGETRSQTGIADVFDDWKRNGETKGIARDQFFRTQLKRQIDGLSAHLSTDLTHVPIVISGMASSSIGMEEIPYATLPFAVDGSQASTRYFDEHDHFLHEIILISGVRSEQDVMRGEETELIGLIALLDQSGAKPEEAIYIFPGTHSKHMTIRNGQLINFETHMTGELFDLMAKHSILKDSVDVTGLGDLSDSDAAAFKRGVRRAKSDALLTSLFTVRTNQLFDKLTKKQNALYLSGLLIGTELNYLLADGNGSVVVCCGSTLSAFYTLAIGELGLGKRAITIPAEMIDQAAGVGQLRLYQNQTVKETAK